MKYTVFYSWQSDLENRSNRSFIQGVLERATKDLSKDENFALDAVVDRDTFGMAGSPSIVESITAKIAKSDVFVCDISIINSMFSGRPTPNPNVLYELGFASAVLGWERIIMIQNTAFGSIEKLPFDLRGRRILQYHLDNTIESKTEAKEKLKKELTNIIKEALRHYSKNHISKEKIVWWGDWNVESKIKVRGGNLHISRVASDAFFFDLTLYDGARTGQLTGKAQILTPHSAYAKVKTLEDQNCEVIFRRRLENGEWFIEVEEGDSCNVFHGFNSSFSGHYKHSPEMVINHGYLDEVDLNEIDRMTGKFLPVFLSNFQQFDFNEDEHDNELTVITAGVKGLYTIMESIVVLSKTGDIWCAFLDQEIDAIRYFKNVNVTQDKPNSIYNWLAKFPEKQIIVNDANTTNQIQ